MRISILLILLNFSVFAQKVEWLNNIDSAKIKSKGPISVSEYMSQSLGHPDFGYYTTKNPFGLAGDFTTSPEISQIFG